jgi:hypothetical protein
MQPDWSKAPEWAQYWAVDGDGAVYWYENEPSTKEFMGLGYWTDGGFGRKEFIGHLRYDWKDTLAQRPTKKFAGNIHIGGSVTGSTIITGKG